MIVGVDVSSHRIDLAWIENNRPQRWHQELAKGHLIDRLRSIRVQWPSTPDHSWSPGHGLTDIAIEYPYGRGNAIAALMAVTGIITRQAPPWARVAWPSTGELRTAINAKNTKQAAHDAVCDLIWATAHQYDLHAWDEHELDALVAAVGWARILEQQDAT